MKSLLNILFLLTLLPYNQKTFALNDYQIRQICNKERKKLTCIKNFQRKRYEFLKGKKIEIPVIPFEK